LGMQPPHVSLPESASTSLGNHFWGKAQLKKEVESKEGRRRKSRKEKGKTIQTYRDGGL